MLVNTFYCRRGFLRRGGGGCRIGVLVKYIPQLRLVYGRNRRLLLFGFLGCID